MKNLTIGQSFIIDDSHYAELIAEREKLRSNGFDFTFKIGKGIITVRRIA